MNKDAVYTLLETFADPCIAGATLASRKTITDLQVDGKNIELTLNFGYPMRSQEHIVKDAIQAHLQSLGDVNLTVNFANKIEASQAQNNLPSLHKVKNIIAVASGKGGVGKSTTAVNLALALSQEGAKVGILDADIYGPSVPMMLGIQEGERPEFIDEKHFNPMFSHGIQSMSMGYMVTDSTPMVWRGPMVSGALQQLLNQCMWHELDYLVIDMPPGTGDIQLTISQKVPVTGAVIVTTPQDIATLDAKKGIEMFRKVNIPVLGVIENMATHTCSNCGHEEHIFGEGGAKRIADEYQSELLASLPLALSIRENADSGQPIVMAEPDGDIAKIYRHAARKVAAQVAIKGANSANAAVKIIATD